MELKIPIEIVFDDVNSVIDELGELQKYKLCEGDDMTLVDVYDVVDVLTRHIMAREAKEPCGTKEGWIPCSERLPEEERYVLVTASNGAVTDAKYWQKERIWVKGLSIVSVTAWMPLPKGYKGE